MQEVTQHWGGASSLWNERRDIWSSALMGEAVWDIDTMIGNNHKWMYNSCKEVEENNQKKNKCSDVNQGSMCWTVTRLHDITFHKSILHSHWNSVLPTLEDYKLWDVILCNLVESVEEYFLSWKWMQYIPSKQWYLSNILHCVTSQKTWLISYKCESLKLNKRPF
jgi:hypothetical protein